MLYFIIQQAVTTGKLEVNTSVCHIKFGSGNKYHVIGPSMLPQTLNSLT